MTAAWTSLLQGTMTSWTVSPSSAEKLSLKERAHPHTYMRMERGGKERQREGKDSVRDRQTMRETETATERHGEGSKDILQSKNTVDVNDELALDRCK